MIVPCACTELTVAAAPAIRVGGVLGCGVGTRSGGMLFAEMILLMSAAAAVAS
jgi:hypothetical protein